MKVLNVTIEGMIDFKKSPNKWWQIFRRKYVALSPGRMRIETDIGNFLVRWSTGFWCDGRSGGIFVDPIFPNWGTDDEKKPIVVHDISFYDWPDIPFEICNQLLRGMMEYFNTPQWRTDLVYKGVSTWIAKREFGCETKAEKKNKALCEMRFYKCA